MDQSARERIAPDDELYRRLAPGHLGTLTRLVYMCNGQPEGEISVDLARLTTPEESVRRARKPSGGLGVLAARAPLDLGFAVRHDPLPENFSHTLIVGENTRQKCYLLAEATRILIQPDTSRVEW